MTLFLLRGFSHLSPTRGQKKTPEVFPPSGGQSPRLFDPFTFLMAFSRVEQENVRAGSGDRSVFDCPQATKMAAGKAANYGRLCVEPRDKIHRYHCRSKGRGESNLYEIAKKIGAVPPAPSSTHCPFIEEATEGSLGVHLLVVAITTKRILGSATQEKAEVPPSAPFDAFISYG